MERKNIYLIFIALCLALAVLFSFLTLKTHAPTASVVADTSINNTITDPTQQQLTLVQQEVTGVRNSVTQTQQRLTSIETTISSLQQEMNRLSANLQNIQLQQEQLQQQLQGQANQLSTGLAGLQQNVEVTKNELSTVDQNLEDEQEQTKTLLYVVLGLLLLATLGGVIYYLREIKQPSSKVNTEIVEYITHHIKQGMKYPHIRDNLLKAGWNEEDIKWAYQETAKQNYQQYSKKKKLGPDQRKIAAIGGVTILLILGGLFIIRGTTTGQAYHFYGGVEDYEETLPLNPALTRCYPPQILAGNACCDDLNNNTVCDTTEGYVETAPSTPQSCTDNAQCSGLRQCVNGQCQFVASLYNTANCPVKCNMIRAYLTTFHQQGARAEENYTLRPGLGSYTGAGALAWTILPAPDYCQAAPSQVTVPFKIERFSNSQLIGTEVIALQPGQERTLSHPSIDLHGFTIRVNDLFHTCGASTFG